MRAAVWLLFTLVSCHPAKTVFDKLGPLPPTPPLSSSQRWGVVNTVALRLSAQPNPEAKITALVPRGQLVQLTSLRMLPSGDWAHVHYQAMDDSSTQDGWLPASGLVLFPNLIEAETTSGRLTAH